MSTLADLKDGESAVVTKCVDQMVQVMGFVPGKVVTRLGSSFGDPIRFKILGYTLAMRKSEASRIECSILGDDNVRLSTCVAPDSGDNI